MCAALIIGDLADPHVRAVSDRSGDVLVIDAESLPRHTYSVTSSGFRISRSDGTSYNSAGARGWIRRLAPADWSHGKVAGSHAAAAQASVISLLAGIARAPGVDWLTPLDPLLVSESKLVQMQVAASLGVRTPRTIVTNRRERAMKELGPQVVLKPLGPGHFTTDDNRAAVVFATPVDLRDAAFADMGPSPFLIQERLVARTHLRVVTVASRSWVAALDGAGLPLDWRSDEGAHHSFYAPVVPPQDVARLAVEVARGLGLGYSSQDWVVTDSDERVLLDVNPGGQWLFLPTQMGYEIASGIADWLRGPRP